MSISTVMFDLDGVIRNFDLSFSDEIERKYSLEPGSISRAAFSESLMMQLTTGKISRAQWVEQVGYEINSVAAAKERFKDTGMIDDDVLEIVEGLRKASYQTAILTNGTDTVKAELEAFGVADRFDAIFTTSEIGYAKPDHRAFEYACRGLSKSPEEIIFVDDRSTNVISAQEFGMAAVVFVGHLELLQDLKRFKILS